MKLSHILVTALLLGSAAAQAAEMHTMAGMQPAVGSTAVTHKAQGIVNRVDAVQGKINLTHGPIKTLGWSGMTMDFPVKDKALLAGIKPGQKVDFEIEKAPNGQYPIARITPAK
jgi:Cu(I)/Ag(I) efflux system membrane fusion protein